MAKRKATKYNIDSVVAYLAEHGGLVNDWRDVPGFGQYNTIRAAVFKSGKARLTTDGGLELTEGASNGNG